MGLSLQIILTCKNIETNNFFAPSRSRKGSNFADTNFSPIIAVLVSNISVTGIVACDLEAQ